MPKIIPDIRERIIEIAGDLYAENSYMEIDMRMIAERCGIAVGTLYNYFPNKESLFISILEENWGKGLQNLLDIVKSDKKQELKIESFLGTLHTNIIKYQGIGNEVFIREKDKLVLLKKFVQKRVEQITDILAQLIQGLSQEWGVCLSREKRVRIAFLVFFSLLGLVKVYPEKKEENVDFLLETIYLHVKQSKRMAGLEDIADEV